MKIKQDDVDSAVVGTAACMIVGSALSVPFVGFLPLLVTVAGIGTACAVVRAIATKADNDEETK